MKQAKSSPSKLGPDKYLPDPTEGIQRIEDLSKPKLIRQSRDYPRRPCPHGKTGGTCALC